MLLRNARLVAVTEHVPGPVDVRVEGGRVVEVGPAWPRRRRDVVRRGGGWLMPGLWDQHVHLGQWTLASARLDLAPARSSAEAVALVRERLEQWPDLPVIGWGHRPTAWPDNPTVSDLDAIETDQPIVLIAGDGHHGWLNTIALHMLALPIRDSVVSEAEWFQAYGRLGAVVGSDGTGPDAYRRTMEAAAAQGVVGIVDLEFSGGVADWAARWAGGADLLRIRHACYADGLDDVLAARAALRRPARRRPAPDDGAAQDHQRRLAQHPHRLVLRALRREGGPRLRGGPAQPDARRAPRRCSPAPRRGGLDVAVHAIGDRAVTEALAAFADTGARGGIEHVQLTTRDDVRRMAAPRRPRQRPARAPPRRPRRHRAAVARPCRALLPAALDARRRRRRRARLRRAGLAARPVAGDRRRGPPLRRRPRAVAPRAVDHRPRGARRLDRRLGHGRGRPPGRPGAARRRPAGRGRRTRRTAAPSATSPTTSSRPGSPATRCSLVPL